MSRSPLDYLRHIRDECDYLIGAVNEVDVADFVEDETLKRAFVRSLEVIGEATKQVPNEMRQTYPHIQWREMAGMRDRLIHAYFGVDYDIVWDVIVNKIPRLRQDVDAIIYTEKK